MISQKPKTKIKMRDLRKYKEICRMNCLIGYRNSGRIWSMKVQSLGEIQSSEVKTLPSHLMNFHWSRELKWNQVRPGSGKYTHFPKNPNCDICLKTKIIRASCRRRAGTVVPRAEKIGDLITADHKVLSDNCESRNNHRYAVVVQDLATQWIESYPCKQKLLRKLREACKSSWSRTGRLKSLTLTIRWNSAKLVKIFPGIIVRRHHTDRKQMGLLRQ